MENIIINYLDDESGLAFGFEESSLKNDCNNVLKGLVFTHNGDKDYYVYAEVENSDNGVIFDDFSNNVSWFADLLYFANKFNISKEVIYRMEKIIDNYIIEDENGEEEEE